MARRDAGSAGVLALLAVLALVESARLDVGSPTRPGPAFFPLVLAAALLIVSGAILGSAWRARADGPPESGETPSTETIDRRKPLATLGALAVYIAILELLGFVLGTVLLLTFFFRALAGYRWPVALGVAAVTGLVAWLVFDTWLQVRLPPGVLGRW